MVSATRRTLSLILASVLSALICSQASAATLGDVLDNAQARYRSQGMTTSHSTAYASLARGETHVFRATLTPGTSYVIHADCGGPCTDVDLFAYDANGNIFAKDTRIDRSAELRIDANGATELSFGVSMAGCAGSSCAIGAFLMASPTQPGQRRQTSNSSANDVGWAEVAVGALVIGGIWCALSDCLSSDGSSTHQSDAAYRAQQDREWEAGMRAVRHAERAW